MDLGSSGGWGATLGLANGDDRMRGRQLGQVADGAWLLWPLRTVRFCRPARLLTPAPVLPLPLLVRKSFKGGLLGVVAAALIVVPNLRCCRLARLLTPTPRPSLCAVLHQVGPVGSDAPRHLPARHVQGAGHAAHTGGQCGICMLQRQLQVNRQRQGRGRGRDLHTEQAVQHALDTAFFHVSLRLTCSLPRSTCRSTPWVMFIVPM